ncbi:transaldolase [Balneatrix alpica]|uniref:Transaldolase n=1 Tax=Balneatrix alpica TaxID=75684 RepID=A0ABV5Z6J4_9GAMM|nr:transaldolase [Balneatrix alpica]
MHTILDQLRQMTVVVADTGELDAIQRLQPVDATTNPSLVLKACQQPQYQSLMQEAKRWAGELSQDSAEQLALAADYLAVRLGEQILHSIPGRISTEVDARLSFSTEKTLQKARQLIQLYADLGVSRDRVLIKIAATWEGIQAARQLEQEGIQCNLTLLFSFAQAMACADAGVFLISPFVGRIMDWHKKHSGQASYLPHEDPGVQSVTRIYNYYKAHGYQTVVMGASFRNAEQIIALAGCDRLTISPALLDELQSRQDELTTQLKPGQGSTDEKRILTESEFRWLHNEDAMATEKLAEGIRLFAADQNKLEQLIAQA